MSFRLGEVRKVLPRIRQRALANANPMTIGALLLVNGAGLYDECGADPSAIAAITLSPAGPGSGPEFPLGSKEFPPGFMQGVVLDSFIDYIALYVGTLGTVGTNYGVTKGTDGVWRVDFGKTGGTARVRLIEVLDSAPLSDPRVGVRFLAANIQQA